MSDSTVKRERELLDQKEVYRQILDAIADMVLVKGKGSRILWANKAFRDYYGKTNEQLRDLIDASFNQVDYTEQYVRDDLHVYTTGEVLDIPEEPVTRFDGLVQIFHTVKSPLRDEHGRVLMTVGVSRNITEAKRAQEDLARYREHLEKLVAERTEELSRLSNELSTILGSLVEGIVALDVEGRVQLMNSAAERLLGVALEKASGKDVGDLVDFSPEHASGQKIRLRPSELLASAAPLTGRLRSTSGELRLVSIQAAPLKGSGEDATGTVLVLRDISIERELTDQRLRHQKLESLGLLASGIAHDFNNILTGILGSISVARLEHARGRRADQLLEAAEQACLRAKGLTNQLLTFARGGSPVKKTIADVVRPVREAAELALLGSRCRLELRAAPDVAAIDADEGQLVQAIGNLVMNAKQAMPGGGRVTIHVDNATVKDGSELPLAAGDYVRIAVRDCGHGIAPEHLGRIFDPYFTTKPTGSGLGLASVHSIVTQHGGHVGVSSTVGKGSLFTVYLPVSTTAPNVDTDARATIPEPTRRRVLVLDDDPGVRSVMTATLSLLGHDSVVVGHSGKLFEEVERARRERAPFDVIFVDLVMPGDVRGIEVISRLVEADTGAKLVVMSGYSNDPIMANYREYGLDACLQKPFTVEQVRELLD